MCTHCTLSLLRIQFGGMAPKKCRGEGSTQVVVSIGEDSSTTGIGPRGAIVVKDNPLWRGGKTTLDPQNAGLVETHLASKSATLPQGSKTHSL